MALTSSRYTYEGTETTETSVLRVGGTLDLSGQAQSRKIVTTAYPLWQRPYKAEPYVIWNDTAGVNVTLTVYGVMHTTVLPKNDEVWMEVWYLGDGASPLGAMATTTKANILSVGTTVPWDDSSNWVLPPTQFDPGVTPTSVVLSADCLTVTNGSWASFGFTRNSDYMGSGRYYLEFKSGGFGGLDWIGLTTQTSLSASYTSSAGFAINGSGLIYVDGSYTNKNLSTISSGDIISIAIDIDARLGWMRKNGGLWNATAGANPATGVGGFALIAGSYVAFVGFYSADGTAATVNFGATAYAYPVPAGYNNWPSIWMPFYLTAVLSSPPPGQAGYIDVRVRAAKPLTTYYIEPHVYLTSASGGTRNEKTPYKSSRFTYEGTDTTETTITRTGGAVDPTGQVQSRKLVTTGNALFVRPFKAEPYATWNTRLGAPVTVTLYGVTPSPTMPLNDEIWMDVEYLQSIPAIAPSGQLATWDPATAVLATLSSGNLVATNTGTTDQEQGVRVAPKNAQSSGKFYFEVKLTTLTATSTNQGMGIGVGTPGSSYVGMGNRGTIGAMVYTGGNIYVNNSVVSAASMGTLVQGTVVCIAVDMDNHVVWFRYGAAGLWNNLSGANPATNTLGIVFPATVGSVIPIVSCQAAGTSGNVFTANFGQSAFVGAVPSGFTAGWPEAGQAGGILGTIVNTAKANLLALGSFLVPDDSIWSGRTAILPPTTVSWDVPSAASIIFSNNNLTTASGGGSTDHGAHVVATAAKNTGKYYFETTLNTQAGGGDTGVGVATPASTYAGMGNNATTGTEVYNSGTIYSNGSYSGVTIGAALATGQVVGMAVDLDNRRMWFRFAPSGNWNNNAANNPATNVGGIVIPFGSMVPFCTFNANGNIWTTNFGNSAFVGAVPSGFTSGWPIAGSLVLSDMPTPQTTLYTLDGSPVNTTMSGGNLIATHANTSLGGVGSNSFDGPAIGNLGIVYYFEVTLLTSVTDGNSIGFWDPATIITQPPNSYTGGSGNKFGVLLGSSSSVFYTPGTRNNVVCDFGPTVVGDVWGVAASLDNYYFWFRKNGGLWNMNASANPATGVGGGWAALRSPVAPCCAFAAGTSGDVMKFNFGQSAFAYAPPTGMGPPDTGGPPDPGDVAGWMAFKMIATLNSPPPSAVGYIHARVRVAKPAATFYIDPQINLS